MPTYKYTAVDNSANRVRGVMEAEDTAELLKLLNERGLYCESYAIKEKLSLALHTGYRMRTDDLVMFCNQMGIMLRSGMQLPVAMGILCERTQNAEQRAMYNRMNARLHAGTMLSDSMKEEGRAFPRMMTEMVSAAEVSGTMDEIMEGLAEYYDREKARNAKIKSATSYPIILFILLILMLVAIFTFVMPKLLPLMEEGGMSGGMKMLVAITNFITQRWYVLVLVITGVILVFAILRSFPNIREGMDRVSLRLPIIGKLKRTVNVSRFSESFSTLYRSGIRVNESLTMSAATIMNTFFNRMCAEARQKLDTGTTLSVALTETGLFDGMYCSMLHVGEESGEMEAVLSKMARFYDKEGQAAIDRAVNMIQPIFIIIMGIVVGGIVAIIITSMYGMYTSIGA